MRRLACVAAIALAAFATPAPVAAAPITVGTVDWWLDEFAAEPEWVFSFQSVTDPGDPWGGLADFENVSVSFNGGAPLAIGPLNGFQQFFTPAAGFSSFVVTFTFTGGLVEPGLIALTASEVEDEWQFFGGGLRVITFDVPGQVPEPASLALIGAGLVGLAMRIRARRA